MSARTPVGSCAASPSTSASPTSACRKPYQAAVRRHSGCAVGGPAPHQPRARWPTWKWTAMRFDGFGVGGALEKENLGTIVSLVSAEELGEDPSPRHLLGISEPDDHLRRRAAAGADTFDCVSPTARGTQRRRLLPRPAATTSPTRASRADFSPHRTRAATATPAPTTPAPTCVTSSRRTSVWRRPSPPSTMSVSLCAWWTTPAKPSRTAPTSSTVTSSSATTTPARSPKPALQPV